VISTGFYIIGTKLDKLHNNTYMYSRIVGHGNPSCRKARRTFIGMSYSVVHTIQ